MSEWYYMSGGQQHGPVTGAQLKSLASAGSLAPEDLVWNQSMPEWVPARRVRGLPFVGGVSAVKAPAPVRAAARAAAAAASAPAHPVAAAEPEHAPQSFESEQTATAVASEQAFAPAENYQSSVPSNSEEDVPARTARSHANSQRGAQAVPTQAVELFAKTRSPVLLISVLMFFLMLASLVAAAFAALVKYDKAGKILTPALKKQGYSLMFGTDMPFLIVYGAYAFLALIMLVLLGKYSSRIKKLAATYGSDELEKAVRAQTRLWNFIMLVMFVTIVLAVLRHLHFVMHLV